MRELKIKMKNFKLIFDYMATVVFGRHVAKWSIGLGISFGCNKIRDGKANNFFIELDILAWRLGVEIEKCKVYELEEENKYRNFYKCNCGAEWEDESDCMCNDRCHNCNKEIEPYFIQVKH